MTVVFTSPSNQSHPSSTLFLSSPITPKPSSPALTTLSLLLLPPPPLAFLPFPPLSLILLLLFMPLQGLIAREIYLIWLLLLNFCKKKLLLLRFVQKMRRDFFFFLTDFFFCDSFQRDEFGRTPLVIAIETGKTSLCSLLMYLFHLLVFLFFLSPLKKKPLTFF